MGGLPMPANLKVGEFRELRGNELKLILDRGAENNILLQKHERILTSGASAGKEAKKGVQGQKAGGGKQLKLSK